LYGHETLSLTFRAVVLYGHETLSLTFRAECKVRVLEIKLLSKIQAPRKDETTRDGENYSDLYLARNIVIIIK
jgi:hypothetical protein